MTVLRFDPNRKKKPKGNKDAGSVAKPTSNSSLKVGDIIRAQMEILRTDCHDVSRSAEILLKLLPVTTHLNSLVGFVSGHSIELRRESLRESNLDSLLQRLEYSGPSDWTLRPAYYRALVMEISNRVGNDA